MTEEQRLIEKLRLIEALFAGAATPGEREAAAQARDRIRNRLREQQQIDPPVEFSFKLRDRWSYKLLIALFRRYDIRPYRYRGQRHTTIMARVPRRFVNEVLWPEFQQLNRSLVNFLNEVTDRVIAEGINDDTTEVDEAPGQLPPVSSAAAGLEQA
ncbi:MAG TPA: hypothetical protein VN673_17975 [Clostridia bacterium]|nr:hypothetical protein [Clostridia bacterium]